MNVDVDSETYRSSAAVVLRYATAIDRRDWALFRTCFTEDCVADYGRVGSWQGLEDFVNFMETIHRQCGRSLHRITNQVVEAAGDELLSRSYVDAVVLNQDNTNGTRSIGWYDDRLVRTGDGWRIADRRFEMMHLTLDFAPNAAV